MGKKEIKFFAIMYSNEGLDEVVNVFPFFEDQLRLARGFAEDNSLEDRPTVLTEVIGVFRGGPAGSPIKMLKTP